MPDDLRKLTPEECQKIFNQGFCYIEMRPGFTVRVTVDDLLFDKDEIDALVESEKKKQSK